MQHCARLPVCYNMHRAHQICSIVLTAHHACRTCPGSADACATEPLAAHVGLAADRSPSPDSDLPIICPRFMDARRMARPTTDFCSGASAPASGGSMTELRHADAPGRRRAERLEEARRANGDHRQRGLRHDRGRL